MTENCKCICTRTSRTNKPDHPRTRHPPLHRTHLDRLLPSPRSVVFPAPYPFATVVLLTCFCRPPHFSPNRLTTIATTAQASGVVDRASNVCAALAALTLARLPMEAACISALLLTADMPTISSHCPLRYSQYLPTSIVAAARSHGSANRTDNVHNVLFPPTFAVRLLWATCLLLSYNLTADISLTSSNNFRILLCTV